MNSTQNDTMVLAKGAGIALFGKIFGRALQLLVQILLARLLGPAQFGLYILGLTVFQVGQQISPFGLNNGVIRFGGRAIQQNQDELSIIIKTTKLLSLGSGLLMGLVVYLLAPWFALKVIHQTEFVNVLRGFALAIFFASVLRVTSAITRLSQKMHFSVLAEDIFPYIMNLSLIVVFFISMEFSIWTAVTAMMLSYALSWLLSSFFLQKLFHPKPLQNPFPVQLAKDMLIFSLPTVMAVAIVYVINSFTVFLIEHFLSAQEVGIYQVAFQVAALPAIILLAFNAIFAPMISNLNQPSEKIQLNELFKISTKWGIYLSLPFLLIIFFMPQQILRILYGPDYISSSWVLVILTFAQSINTGTGAVGLLMIMHGYQNRWLVLACISFLVALVLNIWLIPPWGIIGAAVANACSTALLYLVALFQVRSLLSLWPYDRRLWKGAIATGASLGTTFILMRLFSSPPFLQVIICTLGSVSVFLLSLWLLKLDQEDIQALELLLNKIKTGK